LDALIGIDRNHKPSKFQGAIGRIFCSETDLASYEFEADLARQFNEYIWIDETCAVSPLDTAQIEGMPEAYPFGL
jgi:protein-L-isoaspartate(D-aspartate) O-methyltransferase